jgi:UDP-N-acetylmuramate dehydrogenase
MEYKQNISLADFTTLKVGGPAQYLVEVHTEEELKQAIAWAKDSKLAYRVVGEGSNLLVSEAGFSGLIIVNKLDYINLTDQLVVGSGTNLNKFVDFVNQKGIAGFETLAGIPGTVGGAVYGNAGAYGETISDHLLFVRTLSRKYLRDECQFEYRESLFKKNHEEIIEIGFEILSGDVADLIKKSAEIRDLREVKYPTGIKCPGSFFKNILASSLSEQQLKNIPADKINHGKIPAGYLLEEVGAKGMKVGGARVADYHGNLIINDGQATASDIWTLATKLEDLVKQKFAIQLEPEVQRL